MPKKNSGDEQVFDFNWVLKYLGITNKHIIDQYRLWNKEQLASLYENEENIKEMPFKIYANRSYRGSSAGHYLPLENIVEIKEEIDENNPTYWQKMLIAHEFAHALIIDKKIIGNRSGHGVLYYHCLIRDVVWYSNNIPLLEKLRAIASEFSYSCSLGQYLGTERIFRSKSCPISLDLNYFTINKLFNDTRSDINNLGQWLWKELSGHIKDSYDKQELLDMSIDKLVNLVAKNIDDKATVINDEQQLKLFRR